MLRGPVFFLSWLLLWSPTWADQPQPTRLPLTPADLKAAQRTDWYGLYLKQRKVGWLSSTLRAGPQAPPATYRIVSTMLIRTRSAGEQLELEERAELDFDATPPHTLRRGKVVQKQDQAEQVTLFERTGKGLRLQTGSGHQQGVRVLPMPDYTLQDSLSTFVWLRQQPAVGAKLVTRVFDNETFKVEVEQRHLLKVLTTPSGFQTRGVACYNFTKKLRSQERYDQQGNLLSGQIGDVFEMKLETEQQARQLDQTADVFLLGLIKIDRPLGSPRKVQSLVVEIHGKEAGLLPSGPRQQILKVRDGVYLCKVGAEHGTAIRATKQDLQDNLQETISYPVRHTRIQKLVTHAVGAAEDDREKVERLVRFVHGFLRPSYRNKGLLVLDLLDKREGDCTASAALFVTLARAAGVPAREVSGFAYLGDEHKAFGGHAWCEVVLNGVWVPIDASVGQVEVDAARISLGSDVEGGFNLLRSLGGLSLKLVEVKTR